MLVGWVLIIVGVLNFFIEPVRLLPAHGVFHIAAGLLGVWSAKTHAVGYTMWVGVIGVVLGVVAFLGLTNLLGLINLPTWINLVHLLLGIWGLLTYFMVRKKAATPAQGVGQV